jgi:hypothetical protein
VFVDYYSDNSLLSAIGCLVNKLAIYMAVNTIACYCIIINFSAFSTLNIPILSLALSTRRLVLTCGKNTLFDYL